MNREICWSPSPYPFKGDVTSTAGSNTLTVAGIQTNAVQAGALSNGQTYAWSDAVGKLIPSDVPYNRSIQVDGQQMSDDYWFFVNFKDTEVLVGWALGFSKQVFVNGV